MELGEAGWAFHLRASEFKAWLYSQLQLLGSAQSGSKQVLAQVSELRLPPLRPGLAPPTAARGECDPAAGTLSLSSLSVSQELHLIAGDVSTV